MTATETAQELDAIIARTALKYDLLPYQSKPFAQSQPSRLAAITRLFGLEAAPLATARVLELGCASGGNIIPHAARFPEARFVGVDLARTQVAAGRARIARLGLKNIEIRCQSFTEIGDELGEFDYVICHGVFSWVPQAVQDHIFRIIRARLSPVGVACVSYNVLPGWRMLQPLRDAFLLEVPDHVDSAARVAKARDLLAFMSASSPDKGPYGDMLRAWNQRLSLLPDDYLAHELLEEVNQPSTVREFAAHAARHGLGYLAECDLASMILENYGAEVAAQIRARSNNDLVESEQYLDLLSGRTFRQTMLVADERMAGVRRALEPTSVASLHFLIPDGMRLEPDGAGHVLTDALGRTLRTSAAAVAQGLRELIARFPSSCSLEDCAGSANEQDRRAILDALYRLTLAGMATLSSEAVCAGDGGAARPRAIDIARADAGEGALSTTNLRHESVGIEPSARVLLSAMDGTRDRDALTSFVLDEVRSGRLTFSRDSEAITDPDSLQLAAANHVDAILRGFYRAALLDE
jgi:2-polyprenyl-3-methyl-5-hydroxy-6-metoxy-1,4-benzoquinol methylase